MSISNRTFISCVLLLLTTSVAAAQQPNRRNLVQSLLQTLIESQLPQDGSQLGTIPNQRTQPNQNRVAAVNRNANGNQRNPAQPAATRQVNQSQEIREAGQLLTQASDEMALLLESLQSDRYRANGVIPLLSLAMNVNADAAILSRRLSRATDVSTLRDSLKQLDQNWHALEYNLGLIPNLSRNTLGHIAKIKQYEAALAERFQLPTQVNSVELAREAQRLHDSMRKLLEEIRFEVMDRRQADQFLQDGRKSYEESLRFIEAVRSTASVDQLTRSLQRLETEWKQYDRRLRVVNSRFIQRQVQLVNDSLRIISGHLYLQPNQIDRDELLYTTRIIRNDIDQLLNSVTLKMLSDLPASRNLSVSAAGDLSANCNELIHLIDADEDVDVLRDMFAYLNDEWDRLNLSLQGLTDRKSRTYLRDIETSMHDLQTRLGIHLNFDRKVAMQLALTLAGNARHVEDDIRDAFGRPNQYPREFQSRCLNASSQFTAAARNLHQQISNGEKVRQLQTDSDNLSAAWENLSRFIPSFAAAEQQHLLNIRREITPQVVQLQTLLSL